jgi:hypothetical protein
MKPQQALEYPTERHERRHGPMGYLDYKSFKPWLRDEFSFRCVYCLWRENWCADGDGSFGVDHLRPQALSPELSCVYDNLVYACCRCNSLKQDNPVPVEPCADGLGNHLQVLLDGTVTSVSSQGQRLIEICRLNRPALVGARQRMLGLLKQLMEDGSKNSQSLLSEYLGFPPNLPALSQLHPPEGNARPDGLQASNFERRRRGDLPETY